MRVGCPLGIINGGVSLVREGLNIPGVTLCIDHNLALWAITVYLPRNRVHLVWTAGVGRRNHSDRDLWYCLIGLGQDGGANRHCQERDPTCYDIGLHCYPFLSNY